MNNQQQPQGRNFTPVNSSGSGNKRWEPHKYQFDPNNPPFIEGYFIKHSPFTGQNGGFFVSEIVVVDPISGAMGEHFDFSGGLAATSALGEISLGSYVRIEYHGKKSSKQGGRTYNDFKVMVDTSAAPYNPMMDPGANRQQQPVNTGNQGFQQNAGQRQALPGNQQPVNTQYQNTGAAQQNYQGFQQPANTGQGQWNGQQQGAQGYQNTQYNAPPQGQGYQQPNANPQYNAPPPGQNTYNAPPNFSNQAPPAPGNQQPFNPNAAVKSQAGPQSNYVPPANRQQQPVNTGNQGFQQPVNTGQGQWNGQNYNQNDDSDLPF